MKIFLLIVITNIVGIFALSNIILPLFYTLPRIRKEEKAGNLIKPLSLKRILLAPIKWFIILLGMVFIYLNFFAEWFLLLISILVICLLYLIIKLLRKDKALKEDFERTYRDYLKQI